MEPKITGGVAARCPSRDAVDDDDPSLRRWKQESRILLHHTTPPPPQTVPPTERERSKGAIKSPPPPTYVRTSTTQRRFRAFFIWYVATDRGNDFAVLYLKTMIVFFIALFEIVDMTSITDWTLGR